MINNYVFLDNLGAGAYAKVKLAVKLKVDEEEIEDKKIAQKMEEYKDIDFDMPIRKTSRR